MVAATTAHPVRPKKAIADLQTKPASAGFVFPQSGAELQVMVWDATSSTYVSSISGY